MSAPQTPDFESAWAALWAPRSPFNLSHSLSTKTRVGFSWFRPLAPVPMPVTGQVVVLNSSRFGIVTINLHHGTLSGLDNVKPGAVSFDPTSGTVTVELSFPSILFSGDYEVHRGRATGDALKTASQALKSHPAFASMAADGDDSNITLAKSYQPKLSETANGRTMLNSYYTHNASYAAAFQNTVFANKWVNYTKAQDPSHPIMKTQDCANSTAVATAAGSTSAINSSDGSSLNPNFGLQSFSMQGMLITACLAQQTTAGNDAATAASQFGDNTESPSLSLQTGSSVMDMVTNGAPKPTPAALQAVVHTPTPDGALALLTSNPGIAPWRRAIYENDAPEYAAIFQEEEDVRRGVVLREETNRPVQSGFRSYIAAPSVKLVGRYSPGPDAARTIEFTSLESSLPPVELTLGVFPGTLHPELAAAVAKAGFLKNVLARQAATALGNSGLMTHVSRMLSLALAGPPEAIRTAD